MHKLSITEKLDKHGFYALRPIGTPNVEIYEGRWLEGKKVCSFVSNPNDTIDDIWKKLKVELKIDDEDEIPE